MKILICCLIAGVTLAGQPRSPSVVREFERLSGYPHGRAGFVVDHKIPICAGGPEVDVVTNMAWQERIASYRKDAFERALCREMKLQGYRMVKMP